MNRRKLFGSWTAVIAATSAIVWSKDSGDKGRGRGKGHQDKNEDQGEKRHGNENRDGYFRNEDHVYLKKYYSGPASLPPGLRKKYYRTGKLPEGWEKRLQPFPPELVRQLPPPPPNYERGYIDGNAVVFDRRTRTIVDVINIVGSAMRR